jgi:hypothetical protein
MYAACRYTYLPFVPLSQLFTLLLSAEDQNLLFAIVLIFLSYRLLLYRYRTEDPC